MAKPEDLEAYLTRLDRRFEKADDDTYLVGLGAGGAVVALRVAPPVVVLQVDIGAVPEGDPALQSRLFRKLLELNASDLLHCSYAIEGERIVLTAALELANLDLNELEAVLVNIDMAIAQHVPTLRALTEAKAR
jgi:hypothetical protein